MRRRRARLLSPRQRTSCGVRATARQRRARHAASFAAAGRFLTRTHPADEVVFAQLHAGDGVGKHVALAGAIGSRQQHAELASAPLQLQRERARPARGVVVKPHLHGSGVRA